MPSLAYIFRSWGKYPSTRWRRFFPHVEPVTTRFPRPAARSPLGLEAWEVLGHAAELEPPRCQGARDEAGTRPSARVVLVKVGLKLAGLVGEEATKDRFLPTGSSRSPHRHLIHLVRCRIRYVPGTPRTRQRQSDVKTSVKTFSATPVRSSSVNRAVSRSHSRLVICPNHWRRPMDWTIRFLMHFANPRRTKLSPESTQVEK